MGLTWLFEGVEAVFIEHGELVDETGAQVHNQIEIAYPFEYETVEEIYQFLEGA